MNYNIYTIPPFDRQLKRLVKKYPSLKTEFAKLLNELENNPIQGVALTNHCYKIRIAIASKGKGKSGGARIISYIQLTENNIYLLSIYDKKEKETITDNEINYLLAFIQK